MKLKRITKIKNTGILQDLNWRNLTSDTDFKDINLIFGWNGTGKTTLSRVLRNFELGEVCKKLAKYVSSEYEIELTGGPKLSHTDLTTKKNLRVFNKDFIDENIFKDIEQDGGKVKPIFYLGAKKIELTKERKELDNKREELEGVTGELQKKERTKVKFEERAAKSIKDTLLGIKKFQHYYKDQFIYSFQGMHKKIEGGETNLSALLIKQPRFDKDLKTVKASDALRMWIDDLKSTSDMISDVYLEDIDNILRKTASLQKTIEKLKNDWDLSSWVQEGVSLHKERKSTRCEFCGQVLPDARIHDLEAHFNKDYTELTSSIVKRIAEINDWKIKEVKNIPGDDLKKLAQELNEVLGDLLTELTEKQKNIFSSRTISKKKGKIIGKVGEIKIELLGIDKSFEELADGLEQSLIASSFVDYSKRIKDVNDLKKGEGDLTTSIKHLEEIINEREKDTDDFKLPAEEINKDLGEFLGHSELRFKDKKDEHGEVYYEIKRGEETAFNLSESEKTAISLIYFLRKLAERGFNPKEGIVFIDDPISSLDSQFLYSAYSFIISSIEKDSSHELGIRQFFLATHSYDFFNLFKRTYKGERCGLYMLKFYLDSSKNRVANIYALDPLLSNFDSDYQYMFSRLIEFKNAGGKEQSDLSIIYQYPNIARRVLETFLSFRFPSKTNYRAMIDSTKAAQRVKEAVYRFTNVRSHGTLREAEGFAPETIEPTAKDQILNVLEIMRAEDPTHYEELERSI